MQVSDVASIASRAAANAQASLGPNAEIIFTADCTIDFNSAAWRNMSRKEKNRASAAASRARREAYTESLEDQVSS